MQLFYMGSDTGLSFIHALSLTCFDASFQVCILRNEILYWYFCRNFLAGHYIFILICDQKYMWLADLGSVCIVKSYDFGLENRCCPRPQLRATFSSPRSQLFHFTDWTYGMGRTRANSFSCCGASVASEQQHKQDLRRTYNIKGSTNSRIHHFLPQCNAFDHHFLPQCIAFDQTALRHLLPEFIARRTTRGCHTIEPFLMQRMKVCKSGRLIVTS